MSEDHGERIATLETKMETVMINQEAILQNQRQILIELTRYKGFIGGVVFVGGGLLTLLTLAWDWIMRHWK